ncbi:stage II sporulation protein D [Anaerophilus nitritogenes]|uniref:stage II sporulation protein D n=1 Tax=Anaerophilus nitritogenes TaxID=2498136 RepID=UPI00101D0AF4|nr:stage II sporulation protein D [Anaerophilus nitritogenes]
MNEEKSIFVKIYDHVKGKIIFMDIDQVVQLMVANQMNIDFQIEALKAQAIMDRTFLVKNSKIFGGEGCIKYKGVDLCTDGHCGIIGNVDELKEKWKENFEENWNKIQKIVHETKEKIITINNKPIDPKYHLICGGSTENCEKVLGNKSIYLRKVLCDGCMNAPGYNESRVLSLEEMEKRLKTKTLPPTALDGSCIEGIIEDIKRDEEGRVVSIKIGGKVFKGIEVMNLLGLNSTRFGWKPIAFQIEMQGKGEGLGLCQYGANNMATRGKKAEEILKYYFTGVEIKNFDKPSINKPLTGRIIVLDPGHGGVNTEDVYGPTGLREKDVNLYISLKLAKKLRDLGATVYETRKEDIYVSLGKRAKLSDEVRPDFFLSIHQNSFFNDNISGSEIYHYRGDEEGETLGNLILEEIHKKVGFIKRGTKTAEFYLLREVKSSVLHIEVGFITNPQEENKLREEKTQDKIAEAIATGLIRFYSYG